MTQTVTLESTDIRIAINNFLEEKKLKVKGSLPEIKPITVEVETIPQTTYQSFGNWGDR